MLRPKTSKEIKERLLFWRLRLRLMALDSGTLGGDPDEGSKATRRMKWVK